MKYYIMNKNTPLALVEIDKDYAHINEVYNILPGYIGNVQNWINSRTSPVGRANVEYLLKLAGIRNKCEYLNITYGISLSDTIWFRRPEDNITWDQINPYKNRFSRIISEICLNGNLNYKGNLRSPSPDYKVDGSVDKCWKHVNNHIVLYKTAGECWSGVAGLRPYMEYYASQVADALISDKSHFVPYGIKVSITKEGYRKPYVYSKLLNSESKGLLQYCDSAYKHIPLGELAKKIDKRSQTIIREMLVLDSIILNCDRHDGNYGFLVDNDTFIIDGFAPIYDNDCSLGFHISLQSVDSLDEAYDIAISKKPRTELGDYIEQARWAMSRELFQKLLDMRGFKFKRLPKNVDVDDDRIEFMEYIVNRQIDTILNTYHKS